MDQPADTPSAVPAELLANLPPGTTFVRRVRPPRRWPGIVACVLAVLMLVATGLGIRAAAVQSYEASTALASVAVGLGAAAILVGLVAAIRRWGRGAGIVGAVVGVLGNPLVLVAVSNFVSAR